jgi:hypothetical protein
MTDDPAIERHNERELWRDAANHLRAAWESVGQAQSALEDLHLPDYADLLQPHVDALKRAASEADAKVEASDD